MQFSTRAKNVGKTALKAVGDFHLNNRGMLGLVFGLAAGIGFTHTGMGQEAGVAVANAIGGADITPQGRYDLATLALQGFAGVAVITAGLTDAFAHIYRMRGRDAAAEDPKPPSPGS